MHSAVLRRCLAASVLAASCGKPVGTLELTTGGETNVLTRAPAPTRLVVEAFTTSGAATTLASVALPASSVDLGEQPRATVATVRVTGRDDQGAVLVSGSTLLIELDVLSGQTMQVFVQRTGELARMPGALGDAREAPSLSIVAGRYVLEAGGADAANAAKTQLYDLMSLVAYTSPPTLPFAPRAIAPIDVGALLVGDDGAKVYDFSSSTSADVPVPSGGTFAEVAGGPTVEGDSGTQYVVGPARTTGAPTDKILKLTSDGTLSFLKLDQARLGAAAAWVPARGLAVVGGAAGGAGVELVLSDGTHTSLQQFASYPRTGIAAPLDGSHVVVAGTGAPAVLDLACVSACAPQPFGADPGVPIVQLFGATSDAVLALGEDADGTSRARLLRAGADVEVPFKVARKHARGLRLPTGAVAFVGGAKEIESFVP